MTRAGRYYLTTPIYYVNDEPHLGHAYTTVVADVVSRYRRALGHDVRFLTGTDEHGQKIERASRARGVQPIELADRVVNRYHELWRALDIEYDDFIRTTESRHRVGVERLIDKMKQSGDVYLGSYEGMYCAGCESFYPESQIVDGRCPDQGHPVEPVAEESYFFRLSKYQEPLLEHYREHPEFVRPESRRNEVVSFVRAGLRDLSISRTSLSWGIPFPDAPGHIVYVWVDALTNYMSALGYGQADPSRLLDYWPAQVHLVGKDILRFHAVYWPAFLMSAGETLPECVFAHGWWLRDESKMSKSFGNIVEPWSRIRDFGPDALRYFLLREMSFGFDGNYSDEQLLDRYNGDLANDLGNLTSRVVALLDAGCAGRLPAPSDRDEAHELRDAAREAFRAFRRSFDDFQFKNGLVAVWGLVGEANRYLVKHAPWELAKRPEARQRHEAVLRCAAEALVQTAAMIAPVMPRSAKEIARRLGLELSNDLTEFKWGRLPAQGTVVKAGPLFPRVDKTRYFKETTAVEPKSTNEPSKAPPAPQGAPADQQGLLSIDEFARLDLRVAEVLQAERVAGTDRLLKLQLDVGGKRRQIVAGIAAVYEPEQLRGKKIVVVANLKPARLRGVESQGMLLAADSGDGPIVATFETDVKSGTRVR